MSRLLFRNSISVNIFNNKILMEIAGSFDNNLKELEKKGLQTYLPLLKERRKWSGHPIQT